MTQYLGAVSSEAPSLTHLGWESSKSRTAKWSAYMWTLHVVWFLQHGTLKLVWLPRDSSGFQVWMVQQTGKSGVTLFDIFLEMSIVTCYKQVTYPDWRGCDNGPHFSKGGMSRSCWKHMWNKRYCFGPSLENIICHKVLRLLGVIQILHIGSTQRGETFLKPANRRERALL